jgi:hypothetical protein
LRSAVVSNNEELAITGETCELQVSVKLHRQEVLSAGKLNGFESGAILHKSEKLFVWRKRRLGDEIVKGLLQNEFLRRQIPPADNRICASGQQKPVAGTEACRPDGTELPCMFFLPVSIHFGVGSAVSALTDCRFVTHGCDWPPVRGGPYSCFLSVDG